MPEFDVFHQPQVETLPVSVFEQKWNSPKISNLIIPTPALIFSALLLLPSSLRRSPWCLCHILSFPNPGGGSEFFLIILAPFISCSLLKKGELPVWTVSFFFCLFHSVQINPAFITPLQYFLPFYSVLGWRQAVALSPGLLIVHRNILSPFLFCRDHHWHASLNWKGLCVFR